jgi:hypothetical protein
LLWRLAVWIGEWIVESLLIWECIAQGQMRRICRGMK